MIMPDCPSLARPRAGRAAQERHDSQQGADGQGYGPPPTLPSHRPPAAPCRSGPPLPLPASASPAALAGHSIQLPQLHVTGCNHITILQLHCQGSIRQSYRRRCRSLIATCGRCLEAAPCPAAALPLPLILSLWLPSPPLLLLLSAAGPTRLASRCCCCCRRRGLVLHRQGSICLFSTAMPAGNRRASAVAASAACMPTQHPDINPPSVSHGSPAAPLAGGP